MEFDIADYTKRTAQLVWDDLDLGEQGRQAARRIDRRTVRLPGLGDLRLIEGVVEAGRGAGPGRPDQPWASDKRGSKGLSHAA